MKLTKHGAERSKERIGLNKNAAERLATRALELGMKHGETSGSLRRYLDRQFLHNRTANNMRVYADRIFIFSDETLITVLNLPTKLKKIALKQARKEKHGAD